jgi:phosphate transport system ATP-binding protein
MFTSGLPRGHDVGNGLKSDIRNVSFWNGEKQALKDVNLKIYSREVMAFIGPSGCGKTTLLRCLNRSNDIVAGPRLSGSILLDGEDLHNPSFDPPAMRGRFGWIAQKPNPFP